jgi:hypothetical protein
VTGKTAFTCQCYHDQGTNAKAFLCYAKSTLLNEASYGSTTQKWKSCRYILHWLGNFENQMVTSATSYVICQITPFLWVGHTPAAIKPIVTKLYYLRGCPLTLTYLLTPWCRVLLHTNLNGNHSYHTNCSLCSMRSWQNNSFYNWATMDLLWDMDSCWVNSSALLI